MSKPWAAQWRTVSAVTRLMSGAEVKIDSPTVTLGTRCPCAWRVAIGAPGKHEKRERRNDASHIRGAGSDGKSPQKPDGRDHFLALLRYGPPREFRKVHAEDNAANPDFSTAQSPKRQRPVASWFAQPTCPTRRRATIFSAPARNKFGSSPSRNAPARPPPSPGNARNRGRFRQHGRPIRRRRPLPRRPRRAAGRAKRAAERPPPDRRRAARSCAAATCAAVILPASAARSSAAAARHSATASVEAPGVERHLPCVGIRQRRRQRDSEPDRSMAARCAFVAAVSARSDTRPTALPRAPHAAPNR